MLLAGRGLRGAHYGATRTVKDQPDGSFHGPGDQGIDQHGKHGREFKRHVAGRRRTDQTCKGKEEQIGKAVDQGDDGAVGIGPDQFETDAKRNDGLKDAEQQPDQLGGLESKDALFAFRLAL